MVAVVGAIVMAGSDRADAATIVYVSPTGSDAANGSAGSPLRTVARAVQLAGPGDSVHIASGTYHEQVQVYAKQVHLAAAPGATVVFDGARIVTGWTRFDGGWAAAWNTDFGRAGAPHTTAERPEAGWPEQFWIDGVELTEVTSRAAVVPGTFFNDRSADQVVIGNDPAGRRVEGSDLNWAVYLNRSDGSSVSGITVRRYATPVSNMAAVRAYANNLRLDNLVIEDNAYMGVSAIGRNIALDHVTTRNNGHLGGHAHRVTGLTVTDSLIAANNAEGFDAFHAAGGIKITESSGIRLSESRVVDNAGPGIWTDLATTDVAIVGNTVTGNSRSGIELELSSHVMVANNVVVDNGEAGVWVLETSDAQVWHNALFENHRDVWVEDGPRSDVARVTVANNTMGGVGSGAPAILNVDDWTSDRSAEEMQVELASNSYWLPTTSTTRHVSRWANWPYGVELSSDIARHQSVTSGDLGAELSRAALNPYIRAAGDYRPPAGAPAGQPLTTAVAAALGVDGGTYASGPIARTPGADLDPGTTSTTAPGTTSTTAPGTTSTTAPATTTSTTVPRTTSTTAPATTTVPGTTPSSVTTAGSSVGNVTGAAGTSATTGAAVGGMQQAVRIASPQPVGTRTGLMGAAHHLLQS